MANYFIFAEMPRRIPVRAVRRTRDAAVTTAARTGRRQQVSLYRGNMSRQELVPLMPQIISGFPQGAIGQEFKAIDRAAGNYAVDTAGVFALLNGCGLGSDIGDRIGRQILLRSVLVEGYIQSLPGSGVDQVGRVLIVYDRQSNGVLPAITDILAGAGVAAVTAPRNLSNRHRFKIMFDQRFALNASGESDAIKLVKFYRRLRHPVEFNAGDAGTIADIISGALIQVTIGSTPPGATAASMTVCTRVRYTDN